MSGIDQTVAGLVPAAGASRRMGTDKRRLAHPSGRTVIEVTVATLLEAGLAPVLVVLEPDSPCAGLAGLGAAGVTLLQNPDPARGMLSSIRVGIEAVSLQKRVSAVAIQPGDHPFVPAAVVARLLAFYLAQGPSLLAPRYVVDDGSAGRRGHPLVIDRALFGEALACDDAVGLRQLVRRRAGDLVELPFEGERYADADADLDHPADRARLAPRDD